ncbi:uncharacterized protein BO97DRAFT_313637, partial [Aspergillus homomorphus CBS 101889]
LQIVGQTTIRLITVFLVLSAISQVFRLWARYSEGLHMGADDWLSVASLFAFLGYCGEVLVCVHTYYAGQVYQDSGKTERMSNRYLKARFADPIIYGIHFWNRSISGYCFSAQIPFLILGFLDRLVEIAIQWLPGRRICDLQLSRRKMLAILAMFLSGFSVVSSTLTSPVDYGRVGLWSVVNLGLAIICSCLPTYPGLL